MLLGLYLLGLYLLVFSSARLREGRRSVADSRAVSVGTITNKFQSTFPLQVELQCTVFQPHQFQPCMKTSFPCGAGEGTMHQFRELGLDVGSLEVVMLTHHHGDHIFGLPGLIAARYERQLDLGCVFPFLCTFRVSCYRLLSPCAPHIASLCNTPGVRCTILSRALFPFGLRFTCMLLTSVEKRSGYISVSPCCNSSVFWL